MFIFGQGRNVTLINKLGKNKVQNSHSRGYTIQSFIPKVCYDEYGRSPGLSLYYLPIYDCKQWFKKTRSKKMDDLQLREQLLHFTKFPFNDT